MVTAVKPPVLEPDSPQWFKLWLLRARTFFVQVVPNRPLQLYSKPTTERPAASDYPRCIMYDETLNAVIFSNGTTWSAL